MTVVLVLLVVLAVGLGAALVVGRLGREVAGLGEPASSLPHQALPEGRLDAAQVEAVGFDRALRGYRMDQVDEVIDRLTAELQDRDRLLAELEAPNRHPDDLPTAAPTPTAAPLATTGPTPTAAQTPTPTAPPTPTPASTAPPTPSIPPTPTAPWQTSRGDGA